MGDYSIRTAVFVSGLFLLATVVIAGEQPPKQVEMAQYYIGLIYKGSNWQSIPPAELVNIQKGHRANIDRLVQTGQLLLAGPVDEAGDLRGIFIYRTGTQEEARQLVTTDPAVQAGRLRIEVYPFWAPKTLENLSGQ